MNQSRLESAIEVSINTFIGFVVAVFSQIAIFPFFGIIVPISTNIWIGIWFTFVSVIRSYIIRRYFNNRLNLIAKYLARGKLKS